MDVKDIAKSAEGKIGMQHAMKHIAEMVMAAGSLDEVWEPYKASIEKTVTGAKERAAKGEKGTFEDLVADIKLVLEPLGRLSNAIEDMLRAANDTAGCINRAIDGAVSEMGGGIASPVKAGKKEMPA